MLLWNKIYGIQLGALSYEGMKMPINETQLLKSHPDIPGTNDFMCFLCVFFWGGCFVLSCDRKLMNVVSVAGLATFGDTYRLIEGIKNKSQKCYNPNNS